MELFTGRVLRLLSDDNEGFRHQRFILEQDSGRTLLVAHNIDIAPRVEDLYDGAPLTIYGEYAWNDLGGLIHWTHKDPLKEHEDGWIEFKGERYA